MRKSVVFFVALLALVFAVPVYAAEPQLPHAFYGSVLINGAAATDGTLVSATVSGSSVITNEQNPVATVGGSYGVNSPKLLVQGDIPNGAIITFNVTNANGTATGGTATFEAGGGPTQKNLSVNITALVPTVTAIAPASGTTAGGTSVTITGTNFISGATVKIGGVSAASVVFVNATSLTAITPAGTAGAQNVVVTTSGGAGTLTGGFTYVAPAPPSGGGAWVAPSQPPVATNLFGATGSFNIGADGKVQQAISAASQDGKLTITIPVGTIAKDKNGNALSSLTAVVNASPPPAPAGANIIGLVYNFGPDGATFNPPLTLTWSYDPNTLPTGVAKESLVIAYYDATAGKWVELQGVVDAANNKITASVSHFTTFAIIGTAKTATTTPTTTTTTPTTTTPTTTTPTTTTPTTTPTTTTPTTTTPTSTTPTTTTPTTTPPPPPPTNWPLIGGIIAAVVVVMVGLAVFFWMRRRAAA